MERRKFFATLAAGFVTAPLIHREPTSREAVPRITPAEFRAELVAQFRDIEEGLRAARIAEFHAGLVVERDPEDPNRLNITYPAQLEPGTIREIDVARIQDVFPFKRSDIL